MIITQFYLTENDCYKAGRKITPKGIMVHSTGANNPTLRRYINPDDGILGQNTYGNHWNQSGIKKCVHAFIGKDKNGVVRCYQTLPWNHRGWHAGGAANDTHISFEVCEDGLTDPVYFAEVYRVAVELCVYLCSLYPAVKESIIGHYEGAKLGIASNHADPSNWFPKHGKSMNTFRQDVAMAISIVGEVNTLDRLIVAHSEGDRFAKEELEKALGCGSVLRSRAGIYADVKIKELYVIGGPLELEGITADKIVHLSGATRWNTFAEVGKFLGYL